MADFRLDEQRSKALAAAGVANASRLNELLQGNEDSVAYNPTLQVDDLGHLSPFSFSPRYGVRLFLLAGGAGTSAQIQMVCPVPWMIFNMDAFTGNSVISVGIQPDLTTPWGVQRFFDPAESVAPKQMQFFEGTPAIGAAQGYVIESNRNIDSHALMVPAGVRVTVEANSSNTNCDLEMIIQEFPGGQTRPVEV